MANNLNTVTVSGNLTRDPELRVTSGGTSVANLGIAVNRSRKQEDGSYKDDVSFFDITVWGNYAELVARKCRKGDAVSVQGRLEQQRWETDSGDKRSKVVIIAEQLDGAAFYRSKDDENEPASESAPAEETAAEPTVDPTDDDIPF